jgi:hypothetical protein
MYIKVPSPKGKRLSKFINEGTRGMTQKQDPIGESAFIMTTEVLILSD